MHIIANIISFLHLLIIIIITVTPFITNNPFILLYYCVMIFFLGLHWVTNDDTCVLTLIESKLRGKKSTETFMGKLISPVYKITSTEIHVLTACLFLYALYKSNIWKEETRKLIGKVSYYYYKHMLKKFSTFRYCTV
jgi:hypothetical protein